jgi:hypothetical protein
MCKILLLYTTTDKTPNQEVIDHYQIDLMGSCLECAGWHVIQAQYHPLTIESILLEHKPEVLFNIAYGYYSPRENLYENQPDVTLRLEKLGCHCIGSKAETQYIAQDKKLTAEILKEYNIVSPAIIDPWKWPDNLPFAVLKPRFGAGHRDIQLITHKNFGKIQCAKSEEFIIQEYIDGPEYTIGVFEDQMNEDLISLMPIRISFHDHGNTVPMMVGRNKNFSFIPEETDPQDLLPLAKKIFRILKFRDYGRFDFRIGKEGPVLLDANALPGLHPQSLFSMGLNASSYNYHQFIWLMAKTALQRSIPYLN